MHTGVERIGRYLQVFYEEKDDSGAWETTAMNYGAKLPSGGLDPLFSSLFFAATLLNFIGFADDRAGETRLDGASRCLRISPSITESSARDGAASAQRALDLERFRNLLSK